jgi:hypothetical protein
MNACRRRVAGVNEILDSRNGSLVYPLENMTCKFRGAPLWEGMSGDDLPGMDIGFVQASMAGF